MNKNLSDKPVLCMYQIVDTQEYIFRTNEIKEIIGASKIVETIFEDSLKSVLKDLKNSDDSLKSVLPNLGNEILDCKDCYELKFEKDNNIGLEILYIKGGSAYVLYRTGDLCLKINKKLSKKFLESTYSLRLGIAIVEYTNNYKNDFENVIKEMDRIKSNMPMSKLTGGFPITRQEEYTGYPLIQYTDSEKNKIYKSLEVKTKIDKFEKLKNEVSDNIVTEQDNSLIAVVHIESNSISIEQILKKEIQNETAYSKVIPSLRKLLNKAKEKLKKWRESNKGSMELIVNNGDSLTFMCTAKFAISLCEIFLNKLIDLPEKISACAGIAIISKNLSFSYGYKLAEECCNSAKDRSKSFNKESIGSFLDFQLGRNISISNNLQKNRNKNYSLADGTELLTRPYFVCGNGQLDEKYEFCDFNNFKKYYKHFSSANFPRSWAKDMRNAYNNGKIAIETLKSKMDSRQIKLPEEGLYIDYNDNKIAKYFDVLEMLDLYSDIKGE